MEGKSGRRRLIEIEWMWISVQQEARQRLGVRVGFRVWEPSKSLGMGTGFDQDLHNLLDVRSCCISSILWQRPLAPIFYIWQMYHIINGGDRGFGKAIRSKWGPASFIVVQLRFMGTHSTIIDTLFLCSVPDTIHPFPSLYKKNSFFYSC